MIRCVRHEPRPGAACCIFICKSYRNCRGCWRRAQLHNVTGTSCRFRGMSLCERFPCPYADIRHAAAFGAAHCKPLPGIKETQSPASPLVHACERRLLEFLLEAGGLAGATPHKVELSPTNPVM